jgi:Tol biopolymer transport system component
VALTALNTSANEYDSTITGDGQTLYFGSSRSGVARIYVSLWNSGTATFSPPSVLDSVLATVGGEPANPGLDTFQPYILPDNSVLYVASSRDGGEDLYRSERGAAGFAPPIAIAELNTSFSENYPTVASDELVIYWTSDRSDGGARGGLDIWMATRAAKSEPFANVRNVQELNTTADEAPNWISPDNCRLYLSTSNAIYVAERSL